MEWLHEFCHVVLPSAQRDAGLQPHVAKRIVMAVWMQHGLRFGRCRCTQPSVFPCEVAAAEEERYLLCAAVAAVGAGVGPDAIGSSSVFCNEWFVVCA